MIATNELKAARVRKGLSQEKLAATLNIGKTSYSKRENGIIPFSIEEASTIATTLSLSNEEIIHIFFNKKVALKTT